MNNMSFGNGNKPTITCVNLATVPIGVDFNALIKSLQKFIDNYLNPVWGVSATLKIANKVLPGEWGFIFSDTADAANALGYHDLTASGLPISKIFVKTTVDDGEKVSVTASHELAEVLVDPGINLCAINSKNNTIYAYEVGDPVEETSFQIDGIDITNFVYPSYFEGFRKSGSIKFDQLGLVKTPFSLLKGGYMSIYKNGKWSQIFGSKAKEKCEQKENSSSRRLRGSKKSKHG